MASGSRRRVFQELDTAEDERAGAVGPGACERETDATVGQQLETLLGERRPHEVVAEPFERPTIVGSDGTAGVEIEIGGAGLPWRGGPRRRSATFVSGATDACPGWAPRRLRPMTDAAASAARLAASSPAGSAVVSSATPSVIP